MLNTDHDLWLQLHYLDYLASREQSSNLLQRSCAPVLYVEISCGVLCVGGLAAVGRKVLTEPLMQPVQLYLSNFPQHMLALARTMAAIRQSLDNLAVEQQAACDSIRPQHWAGRPWPLCKGKYESWMVEGIRSSLYLMQPPQHAAGSQTNEGSLVGVKEKPVKLIAKVWQPQDDHTIGDLVQVAWHKQGVAPEVVSAPYCHV